MNEKNQKLPITELKKKIINNNNNISNSHNIKNKNHIENSQREQQHNQEKTTLNSKKMVQQSQLQQDEQENNTISPSSVDSSFASSSSTSDSDCNPPARSSNFYSSSSTTTMMMMIPAETDLLVREIHSRVLHTRLVSFAHLVNNKELHDVQFFIGPDKVLFYGHRIIIASFPSSSSLSAADVEGGGGGGTEKSRKKKSPFEEMLGSEGTLKDARNGKVYLPQFTPSAFSIMLHHIYSGSCSSSSSSSSITQHYFEEINETNLIDVIECASFFQIDSLVSIACTLAPFLLTPSNVFAIADRARFLHQSDEDELLLLANCLKFINRNASSSSSSSRGGAPQIFESNEFYEQVSDDLMCAIVQTCRSIGDLEMFRVVTKWVIKACLREKLFPFSSKKIRRRRTPTDKDDDDDEEEEDDEEDEEEEEEELDEDDMDPEIIAKRGRRFFELIKYENIAPQDLAKFVEKTGYVDQKLLYDAFKKHASMNFNQPTTATTTTTNQQPQQQQPQQTPPPPTILVHESHSPPSKKQQAQKSSSSSSASPSPSPPPPALTTAVVPAPISSSSSSSLPVPKQTKSSKIIEFNLDRCSPGILLTPVAQGSSTPSACSLCCIEEPDLCPSETWRMAFASHSIKFSSRKMMKKMPQSTSCSSFRTIVSFRIDKIARPSDCWIGVVRPSSSSSSTFEELFATKSSNMFGNAWLLDTSTGKKVSREGGIENFAKKRLKDGDLLEMIVEFSIPPQQQSNALQQPTNNEEDESSSNNNNNKNNNNGSSRLSPAANSTHSSHSSSSSSAISSSSSSASSSSGLATISFAVNGSFIGTAFEKVKSPLIPCVRMYYPSTKVTFLSCTSSFE